MKILQTISLILCIIAMLLIIFHTISNIIQDSKLYKRHKDYLEQSLHTSKEQMEIVKEQKKRLEEILKESK